MNTLERLLGVGSFSIMVGHLAHRHVILLASSRGFGLPTMVRLVSLAFLGCWALIVSTFVICFQQDDDPILFDVMAHVKIGIPLSDIT